MTERWHLGTWWKTCPIPKNTSWHEGETVLVIRSRAVKVTSSIVITMNLKFNSTKEETFLFPLKCIDVTKSSHADLDVCYKRKRLTIIGMSIRTSSVRFLERRFTTFPKFTLLKEKPPKGQKWSGERVAKIQATTRPDHVWPEVSTKIGKSGSELRKQEWAKEKPMFNNLLYRSR